MTQQTAPQSLHDLIDAHKRTESECDDAFEAMQALERKLQDELGIVMIPHSMMDNGQNSAGTYSQLCIYGTSDDHVVRTHAELRNRFGPDAMRVAMPEQHAAISAELTRSEERVRQLFAEKIAYLEQCKAAIGLTAARSRYLAAEEAERRARIAILTHRSVDASEAKIKAEYLNPDHLFDDEEFTRALIGHFMAEAA